MFLSNTRWSFLVAVFLESYVAYKFSKGAGNVVDADTPLYISIPWISAILFSIVYYFYLLFKEDATTLISGGR